MSPAEHLPLHDEVVDLPTLERSHDVLAPTLPGHAGGWPLPD